MTRWMLITLGLMGAALVLWFLGAGAADRGDSALALMFQVLAGVAVAAWVTFYLVDLRRDWRRSRPGNRDAGDPSRERRSDRRER